MNSIYLVRLLVLSMAISLPAYAQRDTTPEYSGPSARMDRAFDHYQENRAIQRNNSLSDANAQRLRFNDTGFDRETTRRYDNLQRDLQYQRDIVRERVQEQQRTNTQKMND